MSIKFWKIVCFVVVFWGLGIYFVQGQNKIDQRYTYKRYALAEGLPQMQVTHLMQDSKGFIWVSHWNGLSRFNGVEFENFTYSDGLSGIVALHTLEYVPDSIAVLGFSGISLGNNRGFQGYDFPQNIEGDRNAYAYKVGENLLVTNLVKINSDKRKTYIFNLTTKSFDEVDSLRGIFVREVFVGENSYFIYTDDGYFQIDKESKTLLKKQKWEHTYEDFSVSPKGEYFAYCRVEKRIYKIVVKKEIEEVPTSFKFDKLCTVDRFNRFTVTKDNKVVWFDDTYKLFVTDAKGNTESVGRRFALIRNFLNDREGNLWIATEEGLYNYFKFQFQTTKIIPNELSDMIWSIAQTKDGAMLFASSNRGLYKQDDTIVTKLNLLPFRFPYEAKIDVDKGYMGALRDKKGDVLLPFKSSLFRWSSKNTISRISTDGNINMLVRGKNSDTIYGAIKGGIVKIAPNNKMKKISKGFAPYQNEAIAEDKYGHFWLSSTLSRNIQIYDGKKVRLWQDSLVNTVISIGTDAYNNIWIGNHKGVFIHNYKKTVKIAPEIINSPIYTIVPYNDSLMVLGSGNELFLINTEDYYKRGKETVYRYTPSNGFTAEECVQNTYCISDDGALWIPATNYCYRFFPSVLTKQSIVKSPLIERIMSKSEEGKWRNLPEGAMLEKEERRLLFSFISINFAEQDYIRYRCRLNGYQTDWVEVGDSHSIRYQKLPAGEYVFEVQTSTDNIHWSESTKTGKLIIPKRIDEKLWFRLSGIFFFALAIFLLSRRYFISKKKKAIKRERQAYEVTNLQLSNIKSQLNPHFIFNVMNHMGASIVKGEGEETYDYFVKLSRLIRESLHEAENPTKTLEAELVFIQKYLELQKYRFAERLQFTTEIDEAIDKQMLVPRMCLQILVENAIKHGLESLEKVGKLCVFGKKDANGIVLGIADNGKGFSKAGTSDGNGKGLKNLLKILKIYNTYNEKEAQLHIVSDEKGCTVSIQIPTKYQFSLIKNKIWGG